MESDCLYKSLKESVMMCKDPRNAKDTTEEQKIDEKPKLFPSPRLAKLRLR